MGLSHNPLSYEDCRQVLDRALTAPRGIKVAFPERGHAIRFRHRLNAYRSRDRQNSRTIYPPESPLHGISPYDRLVLRVVEHEVFLEPSSADSLVIEEL